MHWKFYLILGKQKIPGAIHNSNQNEIWIALGVFYFPRIIKIPNNWKFISSWVNNENIKNGVTSKGEEKTKFVILDDIKCITMGDKEKWLGCWVKN